MPMKVGFETLARIICKSADSCALLFGMGNLIIDEEPWKKFPLLFLTILEKLFFISACGLFLVNLATALRAVSVERNLESLEGLGFYDVVSY